MSNSTSSSFEAVDRGLATTWAVLLALIQVYLTPVLALGWLWKRRNEEWDFGEFAVLMLTACFWLLILGGIDEALHGNPHLLAWTVAGWSILLLVVLALFGALIWRFSCSASDDEGENSDGFV